MNWSESADRSYTVESSSEKFDAVGDECSSEDFVVTAYGRLSDGLLLSPRYATVQYDSDGLIQVVLNSAKDSRVSSSAVSIAVYV